MMALDLDPTVQVSIVGVLGPVALALVGIFAEYVRRKLNSVSDTVNSAEDHAREAKEQVKNSHTTNLRDDMDLLHDDVKEVLRVLADHGLDLKRHGSEIGGLRADMRLERDERLHLSKRVDTVMLATTTAATTA
jgi:hypothetical protein